LPAFIDMRSAAARRGPHASARCRHALTPATYVLPLRSRESPAPEFIEYLARLTAVVDVIVVDGSDSATFAAFHQRCPAPVVHVPPAPRFDHMRNGKVRGVLTGLHLARHEHIIIADDDVRYDIEGVSAIVAALRSADVVRPQNFFHPLPWHAGVDTARMLINRVTGGDWPGTLAVRRSSLLNAGGYDGDVLFENLELVRTVQAAGGKVASRPDLFVRRLPPDVRHFWRQRVRQAYDEFARPGRLAVALAVLPLLGVLTIRQQYLAVMGAIGILPIGVAAIGRWRMGGYAVFPWWAPLCAPIWALERGVCAWLAVGVRLMAGGVMYNGRLLVVAAHTRRTLRRRVAPTGART
jgi:hypothetical protein